MISASEIAGAAQGDLDCLAGLDARGFLMGAGETAAAFAERLTGLQARLAEMDSGLREQGSYSLEGLTFEASRRIPAELIAGASAATETRYRFTIDWVPGFFADPSFGWLFGGCAYYFDQEFFAVFIIRRSFAKRRRWLVYDRDELLAHELCHVARSGLHSQRFEEEFAYAVSSSRFRRAVGGMFRTGREAFAILGTALLLLLVQVVRQFFWRALPIWPFWLLTAGVVGFLVAGLVRQRRILGRARVKLEPLAVEATEAVLCRCSDREIEQMAQVADAAALRDWLAAKIAADMRWQVIDRRFLSPSPGPASVVHEKGEAGCSPA